MHGQRRIVWGFLQDLADAEVEQTHHARGIGAQIDHQIARLDVAVEQSRAVHRAQGLEERADDVAGVANRYTPT